MEIASLFRSLMTALPNVDDVEFSQQSRDALQAIFDTVFNWEESVLVMGKATDREKAEHKEFIEGAMKLIKLLRKVDGSDEMFEMIQVGLEDSQGMFYGRIPKQEVDAFFTKHFPA